MRFVHLASEGLALFAGLTFAAAAHAAPANLTNAVFQERDVAGQTSLVPAGKIMPGDRVVYVLTYRNGGGDAQSGVVITDPLPQGVEYAGPRDGSPPETSVDGGGSFGPLATQTVGHGEGAHPAALADVTTLRWALPGSVPAGGEVRLSYRARLK